MPVRFNRLATSGHFNSCDLGWILSQSILPICLVRGEERSCDSGTLSGGKVCCGAWAAACGTSASSGVWCCSSRLLLGGGRVEVGNLHLEKLRHL